MASTERQTPFVKQWMCDNGRDQAAAARAIDMHPMTLSRKLNGLLLFTYAEATDLARFERADLVELFPNYEGIDPREVRVHLGPIEVVAS